MWYTPPDWADLPTPGRQARQTLAGGTKVDRQTATANTGEKGSKHSEQDKQPNYCKLTKLAVYRTEPPTRFGGAVCVGPSSAATGRSPATESDVCPPQRCDSHPNRTPGICARLPIARHRAHTAPAMPLTSAMAASFVAQSGADEDNQAVHHFQWMGTSDPDWVTMLLAWQPEGGCMALYDVWRVWLYGCMRCMRCIA